MRWTDSTQNELAFLSSLRCEEEGWDMSSYASYCQGSGYRLRATSKIGKITRGSNVLAIVGVSVAQACRAVRGDGWCLGPRKRGSGGIELALFRLGTRNN